MVFKLNFDVEEEKEKKQKLNFDVKGYKGNIDLQNRPKINNPDGSYSTEKSFSFRDERSGKEVLIPSIVDGKELSKEDAIKYYYKTGKNLGVFDSIDEANKAAQKIHNRFDTQQSEKKELNFSKDVLPPTLKWEGGYTNDSGGSTYKGVTQKTYDSYMKQKGLPSKDVKELSDSDREKFYEEEFFQRPRYNTMPNKVAGALFDYGVNAGTDKATKDLQSIVGTGTDGAIGPKTQKAVNEYIEKHGEEDLVNKLYEKRQAHYDALIKKNPGEYKRYEEGWKNRMNELKPIHQDLTRPISTANTSVADELENQLKSLEQRKAALSHLQEYHNAFAVKEKMDIRNWTLQQTKDFFKENPPTTVEEEARKELIIDSKKAEVNAFKEKIKAGMSMETVKNVLDMTMGGMAAPLTKTGLLEKAGVPEVSKGAAAFAASIPQAAGSLIKEYGERMGEEPGFIDRAINFFIPTWYNQKQIISQVGKKTDIDDKITQAGQEIIDANKRFVESKEFLQRPEGDKIKGFMYDLGSGAGSLAAALGLSFLTKSPHAAGIAFGLLQKGNIYEQGRAKGMSPKKAGRLGTLAGATEGLLEYIGLDFFLKKYSGRILPTLIRGASEALQEASQQTGENIIVKLGGIDRARKLLEGTGRSALIGFLMGAPSSVIMDQSGLSENLQESGLDTAKAEEIAQKIIKQQGEDILNVIKSEKGFAYIGKRAKGFKRLSGQFSSLADKQLRAEISDKNAFIKAFPVEEDFRGILAEKRLGDYFQHDKLFKHYPALKDIPVIKEERDDLGGALASWDGEKITIGTLEDYAMRKGHYELLTWDKNLRRYRIKKSKLDYGLLRALKENYKASLVHEIQHAIQDIEGFAKGGSLKEGGYQQYRRLAGEIEARDAASRIDLTEEERSRTQPYSSQNIPLKDIIVKFGFKNRLDVPPTAKGLLTTSNGKDDFILSVESDYNLYQRIQRTLKAQGFDLDKEDGYKLTGEYIEGVYNTLAKEYKMPKIFQDFFNKHKDIKDDYKFYYLAEQEFGGEEKLDKLLEKHGINYFGSLIDIYKTKQMPDLRTVAEQRSELSDPLISEAKKYKTPEEFVKAQTPSTMKASNIEISSGGKTTPESVRKKITGIDREWTDTIKKLIQGQDVGKYKAKDFDPTITLEKVNGKIVAEDGNHRLVAYQELGIENIPVRYPDEFTQQLTDIWNKANEESGQSLRQEADKIFELAKGPQKKIEKDLEFLQNKINAPDYHSNQKSTKSMIEKVERKGKSYKLQDMKDHARGAIVIDSYKQSPEVSKILSQKGWKKTEDFGTTMLGGYVQRHYVKSFDNGINGEIQEHTPATWKYKEKISDIIYRAIRQDLDGYFKGTITPDKAKAVNNLIKMMETGWKKTYAGVGFEEVKRAISWPERATASFASLKGMESPSLTGLQEPSLKTKAGLPFEQGESSTIEPSEKRYTDMSSSPSISKLPQGNVLVNTKEKINLLQEKKERAAYAQEELDRINDIRKSLRNRIQRYKDAYLKEELQGIPKYYISKQSGIKPDEAIEELRNNYGVDVKDETGLKEYLMGLEKKRLELNEVIDANRIELITKKETTLLHDKLKSIEQGIRLGRVQTKREVADVQTQIIQLLEDAKLDANDKAKFLRTMKNVATKDQLERNLSDIMDRVITLKDKADRRVAIADLKALFKKLPNANISLDYKDMIQAVKDRFELKTLTPKRQRQQEKLRQTIDRLREEGEEINIPDEKIALLEKRYINQMTTEELEGLKETIERLYHLGRLKNRLLSIQEARGFNELVEQGVQTISSGKGLQADSSIVKALKESNKSLKDKSIEGIKGFIVKNMRPELQINLLDGFNPGVNTKVLWDIAWEAEKTELINKDKVLKEIIDIHKDIDIANVMNKKETVGRFKNITKDALLHIYANTFNEANLTHLIGSGVTEEDIAAVEEALSPEEKKAVQQMIKFYDTVQWPSIDEVYSKLEGVHLGKVENYFPIDRLEDISYNKELEQEILQRNYIRKVGVQKGFTKGRVRSTTGFSEFSYFNTVLRNMGKVEHYKAFAHAVRDINKYLHNPSIKESMQQHFGKTYYEVLDKWLKDVSYGAPQYLKTDVDKFSQWLRTNYVTAMIGINLSSTSKAPLSFIQGAEMAGKADTIAALHKFRKDPFGNIKFAEDRSPLIRFRAFSQERELRDIINQRSSEQVLTKVKGYQWVREKSMLPWQIADKITVTVVWRGAYNNAMKTGLSEKEAIEVADRVIRRTQPMGGMLHLPDFFRGPEYQKLFTIFRNQPNQNFNLILESSLKRIKNKSTAKKFANELLFYLLFPTFLIGLISRKRITTDVGEFAKDILNQAVGGTAFLGSLTSMIALGFKGEMTPIESYINELFTMATAKKPETKLRAFIDLMAQSTGLPVLGIRRILQGKPFGGKAKAKRDDTPFILGGGKKSSSKKYELKF